MFVCMYAACDVCMYVCLHVYVNIVCMYVRIQLHPHIFTDIDMCACMYMYACMYICSLCTYVCAYKSVFQHCFLNE